MSDVSLPDSYIVYQMPLLWSWLHPGCFILVSLVGDSGSDAQQVLNVLTQEKQTTAVEASYTVGAEQIFPFIADFPHPCMKMHKIISLSLGGIGLINWSRSP